MRNSEFGMGERIPNSQFQILNSNGPPWRDRDDSDGLVSMIACIFPGQGSQKVGMGRALAGAYPICRATFDEADAVLGEPLSRIIFEGPADQLTLTENAQPAILAVSIAAHRLLESRGLVPDFVAGHSLGEYSANVAAGTFTLADA